MKNITSKGDQYLTVTYLAHKSFQLFVTLHFLLAIQRRQRFRLFGFKLSKGKVIPLPAWTGPEGSRRLRLQDF